MSGAISDKTKPGAEPRPAIVVDLLLIGLAVAVAYWKIIFTAEIIDPTSFFSDWLRLAQPAYVYTGRALASGEFPLWNVHWFAGYPHLAVPSNSVFYPTTVLFGIFSFATASKILIVGHAYFFGATSYLLGRDMLRSRYSALFLGVCAILGSAVNWPAHAGNLWTLTTISWLPLALLALRRTLREGRAAWALVLAAVLAMMVFGGDPAIFAFSVVFLGMYSALTLVIALVDKSLSGQAVVRNGVLCAAAVVGGLCLAAIQLLPTQEFIGQSVRKDGVTFNYIHEYFDATLFAHFKLAAFDTLKPSSYLPGKLTIALSVAALAGYAFREAVILWVITVFFWGLGEMGEGFYEAVLRHLPVISGVRGIPYSLIVVFISYPLMACGLDALIASARAPKTRLAPWLVVSAAATGLLVYAASQDLRFTTSVVTVPALLALTVAVLLKKMPPAVVVSALVVLSIAECVSRFSLEKFSGDRRELEIDARLHEFSSTRNDLERVLILGASQSAIPQGSAVTLLTGERNIEGYHALFLYRYAQLLRDVAGVPIATLAPDGRLDAQGDYGADWMSPAALPVLDLLNVRYILRNGTFVPFLKSEIDRRSGRFTFEIADRMRIYKNHTALPPLFPIHDVVYASDEDTIIGLRNGTFDYRTRATLDIDESLILAPATGPEPITLTQYGPNAIEANVSLTAPALLVLSEMWYPGWYVSIDGGPAEPSLCVNIALQGAVVEAGDHTVRFFFRPQSFINGLIVSTITVILWLGCAGFLIYRSRRQSKPSVIR